MTYIKKTTNSFKLFYTILAGALLLVWLLLFGTSNSNGDKGNIFQTPRAQADTPYSCGEGNDCTSVAGDINCNPRGGGDSDNTCGYCDAPGGCSINCSSCDTCATCGGGCGGACSCGGDSW